MTIDVRGKTVVITGTFARSRNEIRAALEGLGAKVSDSVGAKTNILFAGEKAGSKLDNAKRYDVKIVGEEELEILLVSAGSKSSGVIDDPGSKRKRPAPPVTIAAKPFADWNAIDASPDAEAAARSLLDAAWTDFVSVRDFTPLHRLLTRLEREKGVTATHKAIGAKLKERGAILAHCGFQKTDLVGVAISNDGRYLATGAWVGDDYNAGGSLQVWDVASGHVVNAIHVDGGVGWPDFANTMQWAPDGRTIGLAFDTNAVGAFDAFGARPGPRASAWVTDGWSRPPGWRWANDSVRAVIATWGRDSEIPAVVVKLDRGDTGDRTAPWFRERLPEGFGRDGLSIGYGATILWCADDTIVFESNRGVLALDASNGRLRWTERLPGEIALSPRRDALVEFGGDGLRIRETNTGAVRAESRATLGDRIAFASQSEALRFAVTVSTDDRPRGVALYDATTLVQTYDVAPAGADRGQPDLVALGVSLDGRYVGVLAADRKLHVFRDDSPTAVHVIEGLEEVSGLLFGAEEILVVIGPNRLFFVDYVRGVVRSKHDLVLEAPDDEPLVVDGNSVARLFSKDATFALKHGESRVWAVADASGVVLCPRSHRALLDESLSWVIDRRYSFSLAWCEHELYEDVFELRDKSKSDLAKRVAKSIPKGATAPKKKAPKPWPPADKGDASLLAKALLGAFSALSSGWSVHIGEYLRRAIVASAQADDRTWIADALAKIPDDYAIERVSAAARAAAIFARRDEAYARSLLVIAEGAQQVARKDYPWARLTVAASLGAARGALGDAAGSRAAFDEARGLIGEESNPGQHTGELATALALAGDLDAAVELYVDRTMNSSSWHYAQAAFAQLLAIDPVRIWKLIVARAQQQGRTFRESATVDTLRNELGRVGEYELMLEAFAKVEGVWLARDVSEALVAMAAAGKRDQAFDLCAARFVEQRSNPSGWGWILDALSQIDPDRARPVVLEALKDHDYAKSPDPMLVSALVRVHALERATQLYATATPTQRALAASRAVFARPSDESFVRTTLDGIEVSAPTTSDAFEALAALSAAARKAGDDARANEILATALDSPFEGKSKRYMHESFLRALCEREDLTGAYEALKRFPKASRSRMARDVSLLAARAGHYVATVELLETMNAADLNDRGQAAFQALMTDYAIRRCGPKARWSW